MDRECRAREYWVESLRKEAGDMSILAHAENHRIKGLLPQL